MRCGRRPTIGNSKSGKARLIPGCHLYYPSRRQHSPAFALSSTHPNMPFELALVPNAGATSARPSTRRARGERMVHYFRRRVEVHRWARSHLGQSQSPLAAKATQAVCISVASDCGGARRRTCQSRRLPRDLHRQRRPALSRAAQATAAGSLGAAPERSAGCRYNSGIIS